MFFLFLNFDMFLTTSTPREFVHFDQVSWNNRDEDLASANQLFKQHFPHRYCPRIPRSLFSRKWTNLVKHYPVIKFYLQLCRACQSCGARLPHSGVYRIKSSIVFLLQSLKFLVHILKIHS